MKLGYNGATTMTSPFETDVRIARAAGFDVLEITARKLDVYLQSHTLADARQLLDAAQLPAYAINSIEQINVRDAATRQQVLARTRELAEWCRVLACPWIIAVPGPAPAGASWAQIRDETMDALRAMNDISAPLGVNLAFEFLGFPWCSVRTVAQAWEIVSALDLPTVGMVIDTCHFFAGDSTLDSIRAIDARKLAVFHINDVEPVPKEQITDAQRLFPGDGVIPLADIIAAVHSIGYDGVASVEIFRPEYWAREPGDVAREAREKMERLIG
ncbi:MAG: sugar phosphate isomerase/epimerase [Anaerolineae bacterium]|nr:sugar phosphate isomerase/epimerase [Anaerolineae bacterium]